MLRSVVLLFLILRMIAAPISLRATWTYEHDGARFVLRVCEWRSEDVSSPSVEPAECGVPAIAVVPHTFLFAQFPVSPIASQFISLIACGTGRDVQSALGRSRC